MIRVIFTTLILILNISTLKAQNFEGTLIYAIDMEVSENMRKRGVTDEMMKSKMEADPLWADSTITFYKNGFYKQLNLSKDKSWTIYRPDSNQLYGFWEGESSDVCSVTDASVDGEFKLLGKMPVVTLLDTLIEYKEYTLKMVEVKWKSGSYFYLYDERYFKVDPEEFKGHIYDGYYEFLKISKSLPIMMIKGNKDISIVTFSLIGFKEETISDSIFEIPGLIEDEDLNMLNFGLYKMMKIK